LPGLDDGLAQALGLLDHRWSPHDRPRSVGSPAMDQDLSVPGWALLVVLVALVATGLLVAWLVRRSRARAAAALDALQQQVETIEQRLAAAERPTPAPVRRDEREYVVTTLAHPDAEPVEAAGRDATPVPPVPAPMFADLVLRESVVQAASLAAGLRRALAPETRHRIRFEMRREVKRARKQRRADVRQARREVEARQRARIRDAA
jgi:hypothetical protein